MFRNPEGGTARSQRQGRARRGIHEMAIIHEWVCPCGTLSGSSPTLHCPFALDALYGLCALFPLWMSSLALFSLYPFFFRVDLSRALLCICMFFYFALLSLSLRRRGLHRFGRAPTSHLGVMRQCPVACCACRSVPSDTDTT